MSNCSGDDVELLLEAADISGGGVVAFGPVTTVRLTFTTVRRIPTTGVWAVRGDAEKNWDIRRWGAEAEWNDRLH